MMSNSAQVVNIEDNFSRGAEEGRLYFKDGCIWLGTRFRLFPKQGGTECGGGEEYTNVTEHIRAIVREELQKK